MPEYKEYYYLQELIRGFNNDCLEIKKWSVATASALAIIGQSADINLLFLAVMIGLLALSFWITETFWRMNQWAFIRSVRELEKELEEKDRDGPQISSRWKRHYFGDQESPGFWQRFRCRPPSDKLDEAASRNGGEGRRFWRHFFEMRTSFPHIFIIFIAVAGGFYLGLTGREHKGDHQLTVTWKTGSP